MNWYLFWKLMHITGGFGFVAAHGATIAVAFRLRQERDPDRIRALLELSRSTRSSMYWSLVVLLVAGIANGFFVVQYSQRGWLWTALVLLAVLLVVAFPLAVPYYRRIRLAVDPHGPGVSAEKLAGLLTSSRPVLIALVETVGILVMLWLMVYKPF